MVNLSIYNIVKLNLSMLEKAVKTKLNIELSKQKNVLTRSQVQAGHLGAKAGQGSEMSGYYLY